MSADERKGRDFQLPSQHNTIAQVDGSLMVRTKEYRQKLSINSCTIITRRGL